MMATASPQYAALKRQRFAERQRLGELTRRIDAITHKSAPHALEALQKAAADTAARIEALDAELAAPSEQEIGASRLRVRVIRAREAKEPMTVQQAKDASRARMRMCLVALEHLPDGCSAAAANLRRAIHRELRRLGKLKALDVRRMEHDQQHNRSGPS